MHSLIVSSLWVALAFGSTAGAMAAGTPVVDKGDAEALQGQMLADPQTMTLIMALQNDPEMEALLNDPKVIEAVQAGNLGLLLQDPRIKALIANPKVQEIERQLGK